MSRLRSLPRAVLPVLLFGAALLTCRSDLPTEPAAVRPAESPSLAVAGPPEIFVGAGQVARCDGSNDEATAALLDNIPGTVYVLGDNVRASGSAADYTNCYGPSWGRHRPRTRPSPGEIEYQTSGASGYYGYFGTAAGDPAKGYYSFNLGDWHVIVLNSAISTSASSAQLQWLRGDLAANQTQCTLAYWHHPYFSSIGTSVRPGLKPIWDELYAAQADVVLNAHYRAYERFAKQSPTGAADANGLRQFTVGTGGHGVDQFGTIRPNSEARSSGVFGVLKLALASGSYTWEFVPIAGQGFTDTGSADCLKAGPQAASVEVAPTSASVAEGQNVQLTATPRDALGNPVNRSVTWSTSDPAVARVSGTGLVTGLFAGSATISATADGQVATSAITVTPPPPGSPIVMVGVGDIAACDVTGDEATAVLLDGIAGTVFTLGDNAYESGTLQEYQSCYHPTWGRHKSRTRPLPGNHEYNTPDATGYYAYFGAAAGDPAKGYYSYDIGDWHVVVLNDNINKAAGSPQEQWLRADLAASTRQCTMAMWHQPRFTSVSGRSTNNGVKPFWDALYEAGADLIVNGHDHVYERWAPQKPDATPDPTRGLRQITAGTGGRELYGFGAIAANSVVRHNTSFGVLKLTLAATSFAWEFIPVPGGSFDAGSADCHGAPTGSNQAPISQAGGPYSGSEGAPVAFNGSGSSDPDADLPLSYAWSFGDGTTGTGATPSHAYAQDGSFTVSLTVTDSRGLPSAPATAAVTVANVAPAVSAGPDAAVTLGAAFSLNATFSDPGANDPPWGYTIDWGDGATQSGSAATSAAPIGAAHTYAAVGTYLVRVTVTDPSGGTGSDELSATVSAAAAAQVVVAAGNIASCSNTRDEATASLIDGIPGTVLALGDNALPSGSAANHANCYSPSWGRHKSRTYAALGNKEYGTGSADPAFDYFGDRAGPRGLGYYSFDLGDWHIIVLNSNPSRVPFGAGSTQEQWLRADLAASTKSCTLALWHNPRFFSSNTAGWTSSSNIKILWDDLYAAGAELVLNGQQHHYERLAPMTPAGARDDARGIRQFNSGNGGESVESPIAIHPLSEARSTAFGVLKLTLRADSYSWEFVPMVPGQFSDTGSGTCH